MSKSSKTSNNQKITLNVEIKNINEETKKAEKLIELLKEAKSLADDLASIDFVIDLKKGSVNEKANRRNVREN